MVKCPVLLLDRIYHVKAMELLTSSDFPRLHPSHVSCFEGLGASSVQDCNESYLGFTHIQNIPHNWAAPLG